MYGPGTAADAAGAAGFEAVSAPRSVTSGSASALATAQVTDLPRADLPGAGAPEAGRNGMRSVTRSPQLPCTDDPELFFAELPEDVETAKALCTDCAARLECLAGAMERREPWGVWGGELFLRGEIVPRKRPRGRPRKTEVAA